MWQNLNLEHKEEIVAQILNILRAEELGEERAQAIALSILAAAAERREKNQKEANGHSNGYPRTFVWARSGMQVNNLRGFSF